MENGSREIINQLHTANRLIPELLNVYAVEDPEQGKFFARTTVNTKRDVNGREHLCAMDPADFERLIADYFLRYLQRGNQPFRLCQPRFQDLLLLCVRLDWLD